MYFSFSSNSKRNRKGVDERLINISDLALKISPIDFGIPDTGGVRTALIQKHLYLRGLSNCDGVEHVSKHQLGKALDVFAYVDGKGSWEKDHLTIIACAMLQAALYLGHKIKWGGWFGDMPHFELID